MGILIATRNGIEFALHTNQDRISIVEDTASVVTAWQGRVANDGEWRVAV